MGRHFAFHARVSIARLPGLRGLDAGLHSSGTGSCSTGHYAAMLLPHSRRLGLGHELEPIAGGQARSAEASGADPLCSSSTRARSSAFSYQKSTFQAWCTASRGRGRLTASTDHSAGLAGLLEPVDVSVLVRRAHARVLRRVAAAHGMTYPASNGLVRAARTRYSCAGLLY